MLPHQYLASCLNISKSSAQLIRKHACIRYIKAEHKFTKSNITKSQYPLYKKYAEEDTKNLILKKSKVYYQESDSLTSEITLRKLSKKIRKISYRY